MSGPGRVTVTWSFRSIRPDAAGCLLRTEVSRATGEAVDDVRLERLCPRCGSPDHGRPLVVRRGAGTVPFVSLSRTDGMVIVAVSDAGPVGVDIERLDAARFSGFDDVALHEGERSRDVEGRAVTWVRKESILKATGHGLHVDPRLLRVSDPQQAPRLLDWSGRPHVPEVSMHDLEIDGHAACVSVLAGAAPALTVRQEAQEARSA